MSDDAPASDELSPAARGALARITREDAVGQLWRRDGAMARLGSEGDALKLDWVQAIPWLLAHPEALASVEAEARALLAAGTRHLIWAGMGGSVLTVQTLCGLGFGDGPLLTLHPLDSTDPAALNAIVRALALAKGLELPRASVNLLAQPDLPRALLGDAALIAVAMGMTSEEPITHLAWFSEALSTAGLPLPDHLRAMSLPGSYLDAWASQRAVPRLPLQLDGGSGTGGRMSAPGTRVFLLPVALWLAAHDASTGALADLLRRAWDAYDFEAALEQPAAHRFVRLAAALSGASVRGAVRLTISAPGSWGLVRDWAEQLFEESLGKCGQGVVIFADEGRNSPIGPFSHEERGNSGEVWLRITGDDSAADAGGVFTLREPLIASDDPAERMAGLATLMLGLQLTMALYGYLQGITFAGQPAVEDYKARARALRDAPAEPLPTPTSANTLSAGPWTLFAAPEAIAAAPERTPRAALLAALADLPALEPLPYLDVTINGEADADALVTLHGSLRTLAVRRLGVPYKLRRAPAAYHSTEQSEMDGLPALISLRALALRHEPSLLGAYTPRFLQAQAVATWQAMRGVHRRCLLLTYDGDTTAMVLALAALLEEVGHAYDATE
ncbi:MAG TPA: hypothetical protein VIG77_07580 [Ktedonobacterales bacterium]|jgi:hypothetical protein